MDINRKIRKCLSVMFILLFIGTFFIVISAQEIEKSSELTSNSKWLYVGGSGPGNYTKIQEAIDNASDGDIIFVFNGTYYEHIFIDKTIQLIGEDKNYTIIDSENNYDCIYILPDTNNVTITDFTIQHAGNVNSKIDDDSAIDIRSSNNTIVNNNILNNQLVGIQLIHAHGNDIRNNIFVNNSRAGIKAEDSRFNTIKHNVIRNNSNWGVVFHLTGQSTENTIIENSFIQNAIGVAFVRQTGNIIVRNNFIDNMQSARSDFDMFSESSPHTNHWNENYWDDLSGLSFKIIGGIFSLNIDWNPVISPHENPGEELYHGSNVKQISQHTLPASFSWKNIDGKDYTTPAKNGPCSIFAAISVIESMIEIRENRPDLNPDLSEQYVLSCLPIIEKEANIRPLFWIMNTSADGNDCNGVVTEACFPYENKIYVPCSEKCSDWQDHLIPICNVTYYLPDKPPSENDEIIKTMIYETGPVTANIEASLLWDYWGHTFHNPHMVFPNIPSIGQLTGKRLGLHAIALVGWHDNLLIPSGGYWICKNTWGPDFGYDGFFNAAYGALGIGRIIYPIDEDYVPYIGSCDYKPGSYDWP